MTNGHSRIFIQLGKNGDFFSIMPILYNEWLISGEKQNILIAREFSSATSKLDFCNTVVWPGSWTEFPLAFKFCKENYDEVIPASCFGGAEWPIQFHCPSFQLEHWYRCKYLDKWGDVEIPQIKRNGVTIPKKPFVLFADHSLSSPFPHKEKVLGIIKETLPKHNVVRLSEVRLPCPTDMLMLYDHADALVLIDTMHLHLSLCTKTPVLAFNTVLPERATGSAYHPRYEMITRYDQVDVRKTEFEAALKGAVTGSNNHQPRLLHVWTHGKNTWDARNDAARRMSIAKRTWDAERSSGNWIDFPMMDDQLGRTSKDAGSARRLPYFNDIVDMAVKGTHRKDVVVLTNADTCFAPGLAKRILEITSKKGSAFAHRWDFGRIDTPLSESVINTGRFYTGADLFAFQVGWWINYREQIPMMFVGAEAWDLVLRTFISHSGGGELKHAIYHERHPSQWDNERMDPSAVRNRNTAAAFMKGWGLRDSELEYSLRLK